MSELQAMQNNLYECLDFRFFFWFHQEYPNIEEKRQTIGDSNHGCIVGFKTFYEREQIIP